MPNLTASPPRKSYRLGLGETSLTLILGLTSGALLALAQPLWRGIPALIFVGWFPVWFALKYQTSAKQLWLLGAGAALIYFLATFAWLWGAQPLTVANLSGLASFSLITLFALLIIIPFLPLWGAVIWLTKKSDPHFGWISTLIFPALFTWFEYLRAWLPGLVLAGKGSVTGGNWTLGNLAYALHNSYFFLWLSSLIGIYGVLFVSLAISVLLFQLFNKNQWRWLGGVALAVLILLYWPAPTPHPTTTQSVAIIQSQIATQDNPDELAIFRQQLESINQLSTTAPATQLVVLPETSNFLNHFSLFKDTTAIRQYLAKLFPAGTVLVDNDTVAATTGNQSRLVAVDSQTGSTVFYDKYLLTPGGEYLPKVISLVLRLFGGDTKRLDTLAFTPGATKPLALGPNGNIKFAPLICSDSYSPGLARLAVANGGELLINQASAGFVRGQNTLNSQSLATAQFRAAENARYLVFAQNYGRSAIIDAHGTIIAMATNSTGQLLTGQIITKNNKTLYNTYGDAPILFGCLSVLAVAIFSRPKANEQKH